MSKINMLFVYPGSGAFGPPNIGHGPSIDAVRPGRTRTGL